jgi:hypothetical protein
MNKILTGALAGFAATFPMTAAMTTTHRLLRDHEQYPRSHLSKSLYWRPKKAGHTTISAKPTAMSLPRPPTSPAISETISALMRN